ncbi:MAG: hypothetical protein GWN00_20325 [Aliifodinibius sp.]|nr:hypothetical protein [Fodinibius sp.]NIV13357.1 hypothetical protein [Fodinibius sp.]NIY27068.1 hypothetical protein [Fodinibius sp.]
MFLEEDEFIKRFYIRLKGDERIKRLVGFRIMMNDYRTYRANNGVLSEVLFVRMMETIQARIVIVSHRQKKPEYRNGNKNRGYMFSQLDQIRVTADIIFIEQR